MQKKRIFFFFYIKTLFSKFGGSDPSGQRSAAVSHRGYHAVLCGIGCYSFLQDNYTLLSHFVTAPTTSARCLIFPKGAPRLGEQLPLASYCCPLKLKIA